MELAIQRSELRSYEMFTSILTLLVAGIAGIIAIGLVVAIVGSLLSMTFGLIGILLFKVAPVLLVGWLVLKVINKARGRRQISAADQRWLDS